MQTLANTLYVQTQGAYLRLEHETVCVELEGKHHTLPLHHLAGIVTFGNVLLSPFLIQKCAREGIGISLFSEYGRFSARIEGPVSGNVLLRRAQHQHLEHPEKCLGIAQQFVFGKVANARAVLQRHRRDYPETALEGAIDTLGDTLKRVPGVVDLEVLRGLEGNAAADYFAAFPCLIREPQFDFTDRSRRPPRDPVNALLSFVYALLTRDCASALEGVGLDPQLGFLHALRPGRPSLALDLMEEFRPWFADRLALTLMNRRQLDLRDFDARPGGSFALNERGRKTVLAAYQERKKEGVGHPMYKPPVPIGLLPHVQARLLARHLRGDLAYYPPYRWR